MTPNDDERPPTPSWPGGDADDATGESADPAGEPGHDTGRDTGHETEDTTPIPAGNGVETPQDQPQPFAQPFAQPFTQPFTQPYPAPVLPGPAHGRVAGRLPGWAWPVLVVLALLAGCLGGVVAGVAVSTSMSAAGAGPVPYLETDNGAAKPLRVDNGSIAAVAAKVLPSTVQIQARGGADGNERGGATGSGFVLDDHAHVITNNHVVADATGQGEIKVVDQQGTKHDARIVGRSPVYDIAVLDVAGAAKLRPAAIGAAHGLRVGDTVVAIGSPLGLSSTVTSGIVSALDRPVTTGNGSQSSYIDALQTDAAINPGNSGGPLVNLRGQVVGVNSAIATTGGTLAGESGNIGVGFAIPMEQVRVTAAQILATGQARYPVIGANVATGSSSDGAKVVDVPVGSPAAAAGLRKGDVVTGVDGQAVTDGISLIVAIRSHQPGETVDLRVRRDGRQRDLEVRLDSKVG